MFDRLGTFLHDKVRLETAIAIRALGTLIHRANVTLHEERGLGMHLRPAFAIAHALHGIDACIEFAGEFGAVVLAQPITSFDILALSIPDGSPFEIACSGPQAAEALAALRHGFTTGLLQGSIFEVQEPT